MADSDSDRSPDTPLHAIAKYERARADAAAMAALRASFANFDQYRGNLEREKVRTLLLGIIEALRPVTQVVVERSEDILASTDCGALWMLSDLVDAFDDLKSNKRHPCLHPVNIGGSNLLLSHHRKLNEALIELVDILHSQQKGTRNQIERKLAESLNRTGSRTPKGKPWTSQHLKSLRQKTNAY